MGTTEANGQAFLEHYGVKGMKWGVRRDRAVKKAAAEGKTLSFKRITPEPGTSKRAKRKAANKLDPSEDKQAFVRVSNKVGTKGNTKALSNNDLKLLNERLRLEQEFTRLSGEGAPSRGQKMVREILGNTGKQQVQRVANQQATTQIDNLLKNARK